MGTIVVPLGTIDLTTLCSCPDPCPTCCGVVTDCCSDVPKTLHATVQFPAQSCTASVITLIYNSGTGYWEGNGSATCTLNPMTPCDETDALYLRLLCQIDAGAPTWHVLSSCDNFANQTDTPNDGFVCTPLQINFSGIGVPIACACSADLLTVTVTA